MSDLTDEELEMATTVSDRLQTMNHRAYVDREALALADRLQRAAVEIRRLRKIAAVAIELAESDAWSEQDRLLERLRAVVLESK